MGMIQTHFEQFLDWQMEFECAFCSSGYMALWLAYSEIGFRYQLHPWGSL